MDKRKTLFIWTVTIQNVILLFNSVNGQKLFSIREGRKQSNIVLGRKMDEFFREKLC